jgi:hypothetical protein
MTDDVFDGSTEIRLRRAARRLGDAALDAQTRDWTAERPDRIGFARLGQAEQEVTRAADLYATPPPTQDWASAALGLLTLAGTAALVLLLAPHPADPLVLGGAVAAGVLVAEAVVRLLSGVRRVRARQAQVRPAAIDDPYFYADLTRRLEACAAAARAEPSQRRRAAAHWLGRALGSLSNARDEITR